MAALKRNETITPPALPSAHISTHPAQGKLRGSRLGIPEDWAREGRESPRFPSDQPNGRTELLQSHRETISKENQCPRSGAAFPGQQMAGYHQYDKMKGVAHSRGFMLEQLPLRQPLKEQMQRNEFSESILRENEPDPDATDVACFETVRQRRSTEVTFGSNSFGVAESDHRETGTLEGRRESPKTALAKQRGVGCVAQGLERSFAGRVFEVRRGLAAEDDCGTIPASLCENSESREPDSRDEGALRVVEYADPAGWNSHRAGWVEFMTPPIQNRYPDKRNNQRMDGPANVLSSETGGSELLQYSVSPFDISDDFVSQSNLYSSDHPDNFKLRVQDCHQFQNQIPEHQGRHIGYRERTRTFLRGHPAYQRSATRESKRTEFLKPLPVRGRQRSAPVGHLRKREDKMFGDLQVEQLSSYYSSEDVIPHVGQKELGQNSLQLGQIVDNDVHEIISVEKKDFIHNPTAPVILCQVLATGQALLKPQTPLRGPNRKSIIPRKAGASHDTGFDRDKKYQEILDKLKMSKISDSLENDSTAQEKERDKINQSEKLINQSNENDSNENDSCDTSVDQSTPTEVKSNSIEIDDNNKISEPPSIPPYSTDRTKRPSNLLFQSDTSSDVLLTTKRRRSEEPPDSKERHEVNLTTSDSLIDVPCEEDNTIQEHHPISPIQQSDQPQCSSDDNKFGDPDSGKMSIISFGPEVEPFEITRRNFCYRMVQKIKSILVLPPEDKMNARGVGTKALDWFWDVLKNPAIRTDIVLKGPRFPLMYACPNPDKSWQFHIDPIRFFQTSVQYMDVIVSRLEDDMSQKIKEGRNEFENSRREMEADVLKKFIKIVLKAWVQNCFRELGGDKFKVMRTVVRRLGKSSQIENRRSESDETKKKFSALVFDRMESTENLKRAWESGQQLMSKFGLSLPSVEALEKGRSDIEEKSSEKDYMISPLSTPPSSCHQKENVTTPNRQITSTPNIIFNKIVSDGFETPRLGSGRSSTTLESPVPVQNVLKSLGVGVQPDDSRHDEAVYNAVKDKLIQYEREQYDLSSKIDFIRDDTMLKAYGVHYLPAFLLEDLQTLDEQFRRQESLSYFPLPIDDDDANWTVCPKCRHYVRRPSTHNEGGSQRRRRSVMMRETSSSSQISIVEIKLPSLMVPSISLFCQHCGEHFSLNPRRSLDKRYDYDDSRRNSVASCGRWSLLSTDTIDDCLMMDDAPSEDERAIKNDTNTINKEMKQRGDQFEDSQPSKGDVTSTDYQTKLEREERRIEYQGSFISRRTIDVLAPLRRRK